MLWFAHDGLSLAICCLFVFQGPMFYFPFFLSDFFFCLILRDFFLSTSPLLDGKISRIYIYIL